jgi:hypothetical protein
MDLIVQHRPRFNSFRRAIIREEGSLDINPTNIHPDPFGTPGYAIGDHSQNMRP